MKSLFAAILVTWLSACANYGDKVTRLKGEVFYTDDVSILEAESLADWLVSSGYFDNDTRKSVQLERSRDTCHLRFVIKAEYRDEPDVKRFLLLAAYYVSTGLNGNRPAVAHISNDRFESIRAVPLNIIRDQGELIYSRVPSIDAHRLMDYLLAEHFFNDTAAVSLFVDRTPEGYQVKMVSKPEAGENTTLREAAASLSLGISENVFNDAPVDFYFVDEFLKPVAPPVYFEDS